MKTKVTKNERLQLLGIVVIAQQHAKQVMECERALADILGVEVESWGYDLGHFQDIIYEQDVNIDALLKKSDIEVVD